MSKIAGWVAVLMLLAVSAHAAPIFNASVGVNGVAYDNAVLPADFELGATGSASLSPHISVVGSGFWGLDKSYTVGRLGPRITVTDVDDPNFSMGIGAEYQVSTKQDIRPEEWVYTASLGWKPWPQVYPRFIVGAQGFVGAETNQVGGLLAARFSLGGF